MSKSCVHWWLLAEADGGEMSKAECKFCGAKREFKNGLFDDKGCRFSDSKITTGSLASEAIKIGRHRIKRLS